MGTAARVYAEQLAKFEFGQALYWPEPTKALNGQFHEPEIGDVGYIDEDGAFQVLFNVSHSADHESHAGPPPLPGNFVPLDYDRNLVEKKERFCTMGPLYSSGVRSQRMQGLISADVPNMPAGGTISYRFKCSRQQGAFLMLWDDATKVVVQKQERKFEEYMLDHHQKWVDYATDTKYLGMRRKPEDIILVRGTVKTSSWTVGAFIGDGREDHEVALEGRLGPVVNVSFQYSVQESSECSPVPPRSGPAHRVSSTDITTHPSHLLTNPAGTPAIAQNITDKKDQCVFLSFYKMKYRRPFPRQIRAAADVFGGGGDVGGTEDENSVSKYSVDVETESSGLLARSPLDHILDYILENSHATVAITSHEDLQALNLNTDDDWPSTFPKLLRQVSPEVVVDSSGAGRLFITGTSVIRHAQAVETSQTNTLFPLDQARLALSSTTWSNSKEPNQAIVNTAQMNQLTHLQRYGSFLPLTSPAFESDFKEWCNKNNIQINPQLLNLEDGKQINLHKLHAEVIAAGTVAQLGDSLDRWAIIGGKMGFVQRNGDPPRSGPAIANRLLHVYMEYLQQFDLMYLKSSLQKKLQQTSPAAQQPDMNSSNPPARPSNPPGARQHEGMHNNMQGFDSLFNTADSTKIEQLLSWSPFSSDQLRAMIIPQDDTNMISINRPILTRQLSAQAQFHEGVKANNNMNALAAMQQQQRQQQLMANQAGMRQTPMNAVPGPSGMQPMQPQSNAQPGGMAMPNRTMNPAMRPSSEDLQRANAIAQRLRQEARAYRAANIPNAVMIPEVNRSEYNAHFEQLVRSITDLDSKLPFVIMAFGEQQNLPKKLAETTATVHLQRQILGSNTPRYIIDGPSLRQMSAMVSMVQEAIMKRMQGQGPRPGQSQFTGPPQPQLQPPFPQPHTQSHQPQPQASSPPNATMHVPSAPSMGIPSAFMQQAPHPQSMPPPLAPTPQPQYQPSPHPHATPAPSIATTKKKQRGAKITASPAAASTSFANALTATQVKSSSIPKASKPKSRAKPVPNREALAAKILVPAGSSMDPPPAPTATAPESASTPVSAATLSAMDQSSPAAATPEFMGTKRRREEEATSSARAPIDVPSPKKARTDWDGPVNVGQGKKEEVDALQGQYDEPGDGWRWEHIPTYDKPLWPIATTNEPKIEDGTLDGGTDSYHQPGDGWRWEEHIPTSDEPPWAIVTTNEQKIEDGTLDGGTDSYHQPQDERKYRASIGRHSTTLALARLVKKEQRDDTLWFESEEDEMKFSQDKQKGVERSEEETHDPRRQLSEDARRFFRGLKKIVVGLANPSESELEMQEEEVNALRTQFGADIDSFFSSMKSAARSSRDQNFAELTKREDSPGSVDEDVAMDSARSTPVKDEKVTSHFYGNFVEKREEAGASLKMM